MISNSTVQATEARVTDAAARAVDRSEEVVGAIKAQVAQLKDKAQEKAHEAAVKAGELGDRVRSAASEAKESLMETGKHTQEKVSEGLEWAGAGLEGAKDNLGEVVSDLLDQAASMSDKLAGYVRAHPGRSFAAAVALGYVAARLMRSRRTKHA